MTSTMDGKNDYSIPRSSSSVSTDSVINLDHGDPTVFESYWKESYNKISVTISDNELMSYFSDIENICWFMEPALSKAIMRIHGTVGNAKVTDGEFLVVGTGSTQLYQAALYALSTPAGDCPVTVVSAAPYYSAYVEATEILKSRLFRWGGDARKFNGGDSYIEVVNTPCNPDGHVRDPVIKGHGKIIYDLAYYWPQYTAITHAADHDIMLFTLSKSTGFAGSRIGWAIVKDKDVAKKMTKFIEICSIGVSKEAQIRAARVLDVISESCNKSESFFGYGRMIMAERWIKLRDVVENSGMFVLPTYSEEYCCFSGEYTSTYPAFAWVMCKEGVHCADLLAASMVITRSGDRCGADSTFCRVSMTSPKECFDQFLTRVAEIILNYS